MDSFSSLTGVSLCVLLSCICSSHRGVCVQSCLVLPSVHLPPPSWDTFRSFLSAASSLRPPPTQPSTQRGRQHTSPSGCCFFSSQGAEAGASLIPPSTLMLFFFFFNGPSFYCSYRLHRDVQEGGSNVDHMYMKPCTAHLAAGSWTPSSRFLS